MSKKDDIGKLRYDLIPPKSLKGLAQVLTHGSIKYGDVNWKTVKPPERYLAAAYRHIEAVRLGNLYDPESGFNHLDHAIANLMFYRELTNEQ